MLQTIRILSLVLFTVTLYGQWELKNFDEYFSNRTIYKLKFHNDSIGYAMGMRGLVLRTEDMGESWHTIETDIVHDILDFVFSDSGDIILTTNEAGGVYKSTNGIEFVEIYPSTWEYSNLEYSPSNKFYLSGEEIIYRSSNDGEDWEAIYNMEENGYSWAHITDFSFVNDQLGFAVGYGDQSGSAGKSSFLLKSIDGGENWAITYENVSFEDYRNVHFKNELIGYILTVNETLKTGDGGLTWELLPNKHGAVDIATPTTEKVITVNIDEEYEYGEPNTFLISESDDAGANWSGEYQIGAHLESIHFINDSIGFVAGDFSMILKTENCGGGIGESYPWHYVIPLSIIESDVHDITIFPNPVLDKLHIKNESASMLEYNIQTSNGIIQQHGYLYDHIINVSELHSGIYFLTLKGQESLATTKFIKVD